MDGLLHAGRVSGHRSLREVPGRGDDGGIVLGRIIGRHSGAVGEVRSGDPEDVDDLPLAVDLDHLEEIVVLGRSDLRAGDVAVEAERVSRDLALLGIEESDFGPRHLDQAGKRGIVQHALPGLGNGRDIDLVEVGVKCPFHPVGGAGIEAVAVIEGRPDDGFLFRLGDGLSLSRSEDSRPLPRTRIPIQGFVFMIILPPLRYALPGGKSWLSMNSLFPPNSLIDVAKNMPVSIAANIIIINKVHPKRCKRNLRKLSVTYIERTDRDCKIKLPRI